MEEGVLSTIVTTGDLDLLVGIWYDSSKEKEGEKTRLYITKRLQYLANINQLRPFQDDCSNTKQTGTKFTSFRQLIEAYDVRYLKQNLENDPQEVSRYLKQTKGTYIPSLIIRLLCSYRTERKIVSIVVDSLLRLSDDYSLLEKLWTGVLMHAHDKTRPVDEGYRPSEEWQQFFRQISNYISLKLEYVTGDEDSFRSSVRHSPRWTSVLERYHRLCAQLLAIEKYTGVSSYFHILDSENVIAILQIFFAEYAQPTKNFWDTYTNIVNLVTDEGQNFPLLLKFLLELDYPFDVDFYQTLAGVTIFVYLRKPFDELRDLPVSFLTLILEDSQNMNLRDPKQKEKLRLLQTIIQSKLQ